MLKIVYYEILSFKTQPNKINGKITFSFFSLKRMWFKLMKLKAAGLFLPYFG